MLIKSKNLCTGNEIVPYFPVDNYVTSNVSLTPEEIFYDDYFSGLKINPHITLIYDYSNSSDMFARIKQKTDELKCIPKISIYLPEKIDNISIILLKYFTVIYNK